nr:hypothetical protein [uncultured Emticicia sp.]
MRGKSGVFLQDIVNLALRYAGGARFQNIFIYKYSEIDFTAFFFLITLTMVNLFPKTQINAISSVPTGDIDGTESVFSRNNSAYFHQIKITRNLINNYKD